MSGTIMASKTHKANGKKAVVSQVRLGYEVAKFGSETSVVADERVTYVTRKQADDIAKLHVGTYGK